MDRDAFVAAILEEPDRDDLRLIYADWLDENGESERAEFIRVQCRIAEVNRYIESGFSAQYKTDWHGGILNDLRRRQQKLLSALSPEIAKELPGFSLALYPSELEDQTQTVALLRRGFAEQVRCPAAKWQELWLQPAIPPDADESLQEQIELYQRGLQRYLAAMSNITTPTLGQMILRKHPIGVIKLNDDIIEIMPKWTLYLHQDQLANDKQEYESRESLIRCMPQQLRDWGLLTWETPTLQWEESGGIRQHFRQMIDIPVIEPRHIISHTDD